ncbi:unnamed protein product [Spirodela intermedia]|uniref:Uncharacterized protein n=1 Tax=Spirodela intermedia TaxID=51605 RepID=A0A7I8KA28_SPIIN|nr:unnamed protein product [Spirodela intermedia]
MSTASKALLGQRRLSFILRSAQQEEAFHRIWYALRRGVAHTCPYWSKPLEALLTSTPRLSFRPACGPGWPAGPPHFAIF